MTNIWKSDFSDVLIAEQAQHLYKFLKQLLDVVFVEIMAVHMHVYIHTHRHTLISSTIIHGNNFLLVLVDSQLIHYYLIN